MALLAPKPIPKKGSSANLTPKNNLPVPGLSNVSGVRVGTSRVPAATTPLGYHGHGFGRSNGPHTIPTGGVRIGTAPRGIRPDAGPLTDPRNPSTSQPLRRIAPDLAEQHAEKFPRLPDVGGSNGPGFNLFLPGGRVGGVPEHPLPGNRGIRGSLDRLTRNNAGSSQSNLVRKARAIVQRKLKPIVNIVPGKGGLDMAKSPRYVPDTPSGVREMIRDVRPRKVYGTLAQHYTAPEEVVDTATRESMAAPSIPSDAVGSVLSAGGGRAAGNVVSQLNAAPQETAASASPGVSFPLLAVAAVALFAMFRG